MLQLSIYVSMNYQSIYLSFLCSSYCNLNVILYFKMIVCGTVVQ